MSYVIGLTGNIATGKSTVAQMLAGLGALVIDADRLVHQLMRRGAAAYAPIVARFGERILDGDGEIDRARLGAIVFADPQALADLEAISHPLVVEETLHRLRQACEPVAVVEAIKLLEASMQRYCDAIWVVTAPRAQQLGRLVRTRCMTPEQAATRIDVQPPPQDKLSRADVVIDNGHSLDETWRQVLQAWNCIAGAPHVPADSPWPPTLAKGSAS